MNRADIPKGCVKLCERGCKAEIVFAESDGGKAVPLDVAPVRGGTYRLTLAEGTQRKLVTSTVAAHLAFGRQDLHRNHFETCPNAAQFSKKAAPRKRTTPRKASSYTRNGE